jgi:hypothetical protein
LRKAKGENYNRLYDTPVIPEPLNHAEVKLNEPVLPNVYTYDLKTEKGKSYILYRK